MKSSVTFMCFLFATGIGYQTAHDFAKRNARVILACRDTVKGEEAAARIRSETKNEKVVVKKLDLSSLKSVRDFGTNFLRSEYRLDILVNNAGILGKFFGPSAAVRQDGVM